MIRCGNYFLKENCRKESPNYNVENLLEQLAKMQAKAMAQGKQKARTSYEEKIAEALIGGAGAAHNIVSRDAALPPLRLAFKDKTGEHVTYVTEPRQVAARHTEPWAKQWRAYDSTFQKEVVGFFNILAFSTRKRQNVRQRHRRICRQS